jgi:hypothetical protein
MRSANYFEEVAAQELLPDIRAQFSHQHVF